MAAGCQRGIERQHVAADDAAGRMHQHLVADGIALRVQALQHAQRAVVAVQRDGAPGLAAVVELQVAVPAHG